MYTVRGLSRQPLEIDLITDSTHRKYFISAQNSPAFWANIFCNYGVGMFVDWKSPKRYSYPLHVYLNSHDSINKYYHFTPIISSKNYLLISFPHVNSFLLRPENVTNARTNTGFLGLALSFDHYYSRNKFLRFTLGAATNFPGPFPAPLDHKGSFENMSSDYLNITNNYQLHRFLLGYGVSVARNTWKYSTSFSVPVESQDKVAIGIVLQTYYRLGRSFYLGAIYRPTFIRFSSSHRLQYEHLISLDLGWRIRL